MAAAAKAAEEAEDDADLDYILENAPVALDRARDGLGRVAAIVRSMKEFAHPDRKEMAQADLNQAIQSTLVIASNEYKYVAEVETAVRRAAAGQLLRGRDQPGGAEPHRQRRARHRRRGQGHARTRAGSAWRRACSTTRSKSPSRDTGKGIPVEVRSRIFDPFFTTKEVGKGTGQGLAIARSVVVEKHGGTLHFETEVGKGTTFYIRLPIDGPASASAAA